MPDDLPLAAKVILAEAAGEGPEGMAFVRDVGVNRMRSRKLPNLDAVFSQPKQFSGFARPDLDDFVARQPIMLQNLARELVREAQSKDFQPQTDVEHFVTRDLYERREEPGVASWIRKMEPVAVIGNHVALKEPARR